jgi:hypothetical protein
MEQPRHETNESTPAPVEPPPESIDQGKELPASDVVHPGGSVEIHPPHGSIHSFKDFVVQLATITAGVLIALSFEGVLE